MKLKHNYEGIQAWGKMQGSFPYYIQNQCIKADRDGAPEDAIYPKRTNQGDDTSEWNRIRDIESPETRHWFKSNYPALVEKFTDWNKEENEGEHTETDQRHNPLPEKAETNEITKPTADS